MKLPFPGQDDVFAVEPDQFPLALNTIIQQRRRVPDQPSRVVGRSDQVPVERPVVVLAQTDAVGRMVVEALAERNQVTRIHQGEILEPKPQLTGRTAEVVMCLAAIYWARLDRIVFACRAEDAARAGFDDALILSEIGKPWPERAIPWNELGRESGLRVFEAWLNNPRRVDY